MTSDQSKCRMTQTVQTRQPQAFHVMAKPTGAQCNMDCAYCFFLKKDRLYPGSAFRMSDKVMESYVRQALQAGQAAIAWQGGEPTLMGLDFFRRAMAVEKKHLKPGVAIENTLQTNGILIDEDWCRFLHDNQYLVGISLDGPRFLHDVYRRDKGGNPTFDKVVEAVRLMKEHKVEFNILCTVNAVNSRHPLDVYRFFRDELDARYIQFIPIVEKDEGRGAGGELKITDRSVPSGQYGRFLIVVFDEWVKRDVGTVFVPFFDAVLASYVYGQSSMCVLRPTCGDALALEHNGDLYSCDHFVEPRHLLGNITQTPLAALAMSTEQQDFGRGKSSGLPRTCRQCRFLFTCHGECPKNRVLTTAEGEPGLNWLCEGLKVFFEHTEQPMKEMANLLKSGRYADEIMSRPQEEVQMANTRP